MDLNLLPLKPPDFRPLLLPDEDQVFVGTLTTSIALGGLVMLHTMSLEPPADLTITTLPIRFLSLGEGVGSPPSDATEPSLEEMLALDMPERPLSDLISPALTGPRAIAVTPGSLSDVFKVPTKMDVQMTPVDFPYTQNFIVYIDGQADTEVRYRG